VVVLRELSRLFYTSSGDKELKRPKWAKIVEVIVLGPKDSRVIEKRM